MLQLKKPNPLTLPQITTESGPLALQTKSQKNHKERHYPSSRLLLYDSVMPSCPLGFASQQITQFLSSCMTPYSTSTIERDSVLSLLCLDMFPNSCITSCVNFPFLRSHFVLTLSIDYLYVSIVHMNDHLGNQVDSFHL